MLLNKSYVFRYIFKEKQQNKNGKKKERKKEQRKKEMNRARTPHLRIVANTLLRLDTSLWRKVCYLLRFSQTREF